MRPRILRTGAGLAALTVAVYPLLWRDRCQTWGARPEEAEREMPGDSLLPAAAVVTTRAISVAAPPPAIWPWLAQVGSAGGGSDSHDRVETWSGAAPRDVDGAVPGRQSLVVGDIVTVGGTLRMRVAVLDPAQSMVLVSEDGSRVWSFGLYPDSVVLTRLVSRKRVQDPGAGRAVRALSMYLLEPAGLIMERRMLLGIRESAERLRRQREAAGRRARARAGTLSGAGSTRRLR